MAEARVLVVEDAEAIRVAVEAGLRAAGFTVRGQVHGNDLERELHGFRPDLVVLDVMLPGRLRCVPPARGTTGAVFRLDLPASSRPRHGP